MLNLLKIYKMPISIKIKNFNDQKIIQKKIYDNLFLDKKKIGKYPRYIKIHNIGKSSVEEIRDLHLCNNVIYQMIEN